MSSSAPSNAPQNAVTVRAILGLIGAALLLVASASLVTLIRLFSLSADSRPDWFATNDLIVAALLAVVALSVLMLSINLLSAAWRGRSRNIIPGPTLYLFGVTLIILGMFQLAAGAMTSALILAFIGAIAMWLEVQFEFI